MPTKNYSVYTAELGAILAEQDRAVTALADRVRSDVVVPFCRKHRLGFIQGMGTFYFYRGEITFGESYNLPNGTLGRDMKRIYDLLRSEIDRVQELGYYVQDVPEQSSQERKNTQ